MTETIILSIALFIGIFVQTTIGFAASLASLPIILSDRQGFKHLGLSEIYKNTLLV